MWVEELLSVLLFFFFETQVLVFFIFVFFCCCIFVFVAFLRDWEEEHGDGKKAKNDDCLSWSWSCCRWLVFETHWSSNEGEPHKKYWEKKKKKNTNKIVFLHLMHMNYSVLLMYSCNTHVLMCTIGVNYSTRFVCVGVLTLPALWPAPLLWNRASRPDVPHDGGAGCGANHVQHHHHQCCFWPEEGHWHGLPYCWTVWHEQTGMTLCECFFVCLFVCLFFLGVCVTILCCVHLFSCLFIYLRNGLFGWLIVLVFFIIISFLTVVNQSFVKKYTLEEQNKQNKQNNQNKQNKQNKVGPLAIETSHNTEGKRRYSDELTATLDKEVSYFVSMFWR